MTNNTEQQNTHDWKDIASDKMQDEAFGGKSVWNEMTRLSIKHKSVNMGQGFPNYSEKFVMEASAKILTDRVEDDPKATQYSHSQGHPELRKAVANIFYGADDFGYKNDDPSQGKRKISWENEVAICNGASGGLYNAAQAFINPGDEVIIIEPFYGVYLQTFLLAGAELVYVPVKSPKEGELPSDANGMELDWDLFEKSFSPKTKMVVFNTPHNPTGKIFSRKEIEHVVQIMEKHPNVIMFADEVYEKIVFNETNPHIHIASYPGMWERTLTVSSAGKTFSATGMKLGWLVGPQHLIKPCFLVHTYSNFCSPTPLQLGIAKAIEVAEKDNYYKYISKKYKKKRDHLVESFQTAFGKENVLVPVSSYFVIVHIGHVPFPEKKGEKRDFAFCKWFIENYGVTGIPLSVFYSPDHASYGENYVRFAYCKDDDTLNKARERLIVFKKDFESDSLKM
mmetsp:Transcript_1729/g.2546  ORF Transcript_1729/g.2546 Transcript_1729/m.2546 type:complete len:452 (+) Transcript_1729:59-1414(+)